MHVNYTYRIITNQKDLLPLKEHWNHLASLHPDYELFISYDWYELWLEYFLASNKLCVVGIFNNDRLVAIAPFIEKEETIKNIPITKLELLGNAYSPFRSFIIDPLEDKKKIGKILTSALNLIKSEWNIIQIGPLCDGVSHEYAETIIGHLGYQSIERNIDVNWRIQNQYEDFEAYLSTRKSKFRQEIKRRAKKLNVSGNVEIVISENQEAEKLINDYEKVYTKSWKQGEGIGPGFHADLAKIASDKKQLLIAIIYLDDEPIAAQYRIICGNKCYFLKTAYDAQYQKYSAGFVLLYEDIKYLIDDRKISIIDFGPGNETYKSEWADTFGEYREFIVFNNTIKGTLIYRGYTRLFPFLSRVKNLIKNRTIDDDQV